MTCLIQVNRVMILQKGKCQQCPVTTIDHLYKKLANDVLQTKKQFPHNSLPLYQAIPRRNYMSDQQNRQPIWLPYPTPRLVIEHPTSSSNQVVMCDFHLKIDHDGISFPEMTRFM